MLVNKSNYLGKQIGSYRVVDCLGSGGFADVYLGEHIYLKTQSAIKTLHVQLSRRALQNFLNEAKIIARLEHPNIIRVFDYGVQEGSPFLVMNYAPNGNLRQRYPRGTRLPLEHITTYVQQAASALDYAHQLNLIHRDVKPANMLIGQQQQLLLSDFGLALAISDADSPLDSSMLDPDSDPQPKIHTARPASASQPDTSIINSDVDSNSSYNSDSNSRPKIDTAISGFVLEQSISLTNSDSDPQPKISTAGTIPYMAPEQLLGKACYASDQYALGIIAYEWICGEYPFTGSYIKIASQHVLATPPSLNARVPNLPPGVEQVVFKALAKDPAQRFASVGDFAQALLQACQIVSSTTILTKENTISVFEGNITYDDSADATDKKKPLALISEQDRSDNSNEHNISHKLQTQYDAAKIVTSSQSALDMSDPSSDSDTTYSTLKLPAQADLTYDASNLSASSDIAHDASNTPPDLPSQPITIQNVPIAIDRPRKRKLRFVLLGVAIATLTISSIILGLIWYSNAHPTLAKGPMQQRSTLLQKSTQQPTTQKTVLPGTTTTSIPPLPTSIVNANGTPATNPQPIPVSLTPGATAPPVPTSLPKPTPTPAPVADCIQGSLSNIAFASPPNPVKSRVRQLSLTNCGGSGSTNWQASIQSSGWLSLSASSGSINPGDRIIIQVQTNVNGMAVGTYRGLITFTAGKSSWVVNVTYVIK